MRASNVGHYTNSEKIKGIGGIEPPTLDSRGIEPRTTPNSWWASWKKAIQMLREYYTTKPQAPRGGSDELPVWSLGSLKQNMLFVWIGLDLWWWCR
ncbi:hypothetical protein F4860DRAFT_260126 [Xylaria cubensis]|nr:hypothetical protein F4860DRAFT_260126 [Xylaria cubensis]